MGLRICTSTYVAHPHRQHIYFKSRPQRLSSLFGSTSIHTIIEQVHRWYYLMCAPRQHPITSPQLAQQAGNPSLFADHSIRISGIVLGLKSPPPAQFRL
ncbi:hypothetical protein GGP41_008452 [Bipolaris sorokiniana]|uniref:Uncharacterized protein n=1 Tax=Cochliobolus sativus TaxID=45130 RepID=A0A8H5Z9A2_COCSA|nr:hypothetical protein GGP41_008452 [Bipolaris sorokiniana]